MASHFDKAKKCCGFHGYKDGGNLFFFPRWSLLELVSCHSSMTWDRRACELSAVFVSYDSLRAWLYT